MNTVDTMISLEVGGQPATLQKTFKQVFVGSSYSQSATIPLEYTFDETNGVFSTVEDMFNDEDESARQVGLEARGWLSNDVNSTIEIFAKIATPSQFRQPSSIPDDPTPEIEQGYAGYIYWDATSVRAYPSPAKSIGGKIYLTAYEDPSQYVNSAGVRNNSLETQGVGLYHPSTSYGHGFVAPQLPPEDKWRFIGLSDQGVMDVSLGKQVFPTTKYKSIVVRQGTSEQIKWSLENQYPIIEIASGTEFNLQYLPMMSMRDHLDATVTGNYFDTKEIPATDYDYMYPIDWRNASVRRTLNWSPQNFGTLLPNKWRDIVTYTQTRPVYYTLQYELRLGSRKMTLTTVLKVNP